MAKLDGKVAIITGASSGIGEATAEALAAEGASVVVAARREDRFLRPRREDKQQRGQGPLRLRRRHRRGAGARADTEDEERVRPGGYPGEQRGRDATLGRRQGPFGRMAPDVRRERPRPPLRHRCGGRGHEGAGIRAPGEHFIGRRATEPGYHRGLLGDEVRVNAISEALRQELLEDSIRVTIVEPGAVATELATHITDEDAKESLSGLLSLDILQAEDIANASPTASPSPNA